MMYWLPWVQGFTLGAGLIIPIGAQNAFVLNQGMRRQYHLLVAGICSLFDVLLISLGVFGGGAALQSHGVLYWGISLAGMAFLLLYGAHCWRRVFRSGQSLALSKQERGLKAVIIGVLAVTLLNPQVYIETVMILGSVGGGFAERGIGADQLPDAHPELQFEDVHASWRVFWPQAGDRVLDVGAGSHR